MRVFLLPDSFSEDSPLVLEGRQRNYIVNVLRLREGQHLTGRDRSANPWDLVITGITPTSCTMSAARIPEPVATTDALPQERPSVPIILYQCLPKGRKMDEIIRMATEAGVLEIVPVMSRNCVADIGSRAQSKAVRYNAVIKEAIQQSGSMVPTSAASPIDISMVPGHFEKYCRAQGLEGMGLFFHQDRLSETQKTLQQILSGFAGPVALVIGPEGGLSGTEVDMFCKGSFYPVLLKTNILRCETAAIYAISAVQTLLGKGC